MGFPTRSNTNWAVQHYKMRLEISDLGSRGIVLSLTKTNALISCGVTAQLISAFVLAYTCM